MIKILKDFQNKSLLKLKQFQKLFKYEKINNFLQFNSNLSHPKEPKFEATIKPAEVSLT